MQLTVRAPVGKLTQSRVEAVGAAVARHGFVAEVALEGASGRAWAKGPEVVALLPDQLVLVFPTEPGENPNLALMAEVLVAILRAVMLDDTERQFPFVLQVWGQLSSPQDVMSYSRRSVTRLPLRSTESYS